LPRSWVRLPVDTVQPRRRILVQGFQAQWVITLVVWAGVLISVFAVILVGPLAWTTAAGSAPAAMAAALLVLHERLWLPLLALFLSLIVLALRMTHGVAGPLYRFRKVFAELGRGNFTVRTAIRKHDYLQLESQTLGEMVAALAARIERAQRLVASLDDELSRLEQQGGTLDRTRVAVLQAHARTAREALDEFTTTRPTVNAGPAPETATATEPASDSGFSLVELLVAMAIAAAVVSIALPNYMGAVNRARVAGAIGDIGAIDKDITVYKLNHGCFPPSLADIGHADTIDPWGATYEYGVPQAPGGGGRGGRKGGGGAAAGSCQACGGACIGAGAARKDRNLVPINADYDLYSKGADGQSVGPLSAGPSQDDVIRGRTGSFVGLASEY